MTKQDILQAIDDGDLQPKFAEHLSSIENVLEQAQFTRDFIDTLKSLENEKIIYPFKTVGATLGAIIPASWDEIRRHE
jgi:hypothetical protein